MENIQMLLTFGGRCNCYFWDIRLKMLSLPNFSMLFQLVLTKFFKSELFSCLPNLDHVIKSCKGPIIKGAIHSTKIPTGPTGKRGPPQKVDPFFRNFSVGPNRSIEFWTEISGKFGWMDRALSLKQDRMVERVTLTKNWIIVSVYRPRAARQ